MIMELQGQVVVYSLTGCPHCVAAKTSLRDRQVPFIDVAADRFPEVRSWLQEKTGKTSVPQIFFNEKHIGGNDDLQKILKNEDEWQELLKEVTENRSKEGELLLPHPSQATDEAEDFGSFVGKADPAATTVEELKSSGILHDHRVSFFSIHKKSFSGGQFVKWIMDARGIGEEEAIKIGGELLDKKYIKPLPDNKSLTFTNDEKAYYSMYECSESKALNAGPSQNYLLDNASEFSESLRRLILTLYSDHISPDGKTVNYKAMKDTEGYKEYVKLSRELQRVPVEKLDQDERKAFFINLYNTLVIHATVEDGPPSNIVSRMKFYDKASYIIGGNVFSLNDIENGVLRGNKRGAAQLFPPFGKSDPRRNISLIQVDPRIHFALNCGAKSCPPIKTFTAENINDELKLATEAYLETDEALMINEENNVIHLSSLLRWYSSDFGNTTEDVLQWVLRNVSFAEKKEALEKILELKKYKVQYISYDWSTNSAD